MGNHEKAPDASHPVYLDSSNVDNSTVAFGALFHLTGPDPMWRNKADCGFQVRMEKWIIGGLERNALLRFTRAIHEGLGRAGGRDSW